MRSDLPNQSNTIQDFYHSRQRRVLSSRTSWLPSEWTSHHRSEVRRIRFWELSPSLFSDLLSISATTATAVLLGFISTCSGQTDHGQEEGENQLLFPAFWQKLLNISCKINESFKNFITKSFSNPAALVLCAKDEFRKHWLTCVHVASPAAASRLDVVWEKKSQTLHKTEVNVFRYFAVDKRGKVEWYAEAEGNSHLDSPCNRMCVWERQFFHYATYTARLFRAWGCFRTQMSIESLLDSKHR